VEEWPVLRDKTSDTYRDGMDNGMTSKMERSVFGIEKLFCRS
jgi:hypothetical protein